VKRRQVEKMTEKTPCLAFRLHETNNILLLKQERDLFVSLTMLLN